MGKDKKKPAAAELDLPAAEVANHLRRLDRLKKRLLSATNELVEATANRKSMAKIYADLVKGVVSAIDAAGVSGAERLRSVRTWRQELRKAGLALARAKQEQRELRDKRDGILRQLYEEIDEPTAMLFDTE